MNRFDIVFSDIQLPDFDGYELARMVRSMQHTQARIPLIAVTANSTEDLSELSKNSGFDNFLVKPLTIESVRYMFKKHLSLKKLQQAK